MTPPNRGTLVLGSGMLGLLVMVVVACFPGSDSNGQPQPSNRALSLRDIPFDGAAAYRRLQQICEMGPRPSGSAGMQQQQDLLKQYFEQLGGNVELQGFQYRHPLDGSAVPMANLVVRWHPDRKERILLCAHYDTRPYPDRDPDPSARKGRFIGANDGASGVALLMEMGRHMPKFSSPLGVDFALFDGEEFVFNDGDRYFLGSEWFARGYAADKQRNYEYRAAVLLDMVGDRYLQLYQERNGKRWRDSRWIVNTLWKKAEFLGVKEFIPRLYNQEILDDHIKLHDIGGIPACDIIDFSYRSRDRRQNYWHTRADTPDKCSALSLAKVGWVVHEWLKDEGRK